jgi:hypothetical protein
VIYKKDLPLEVKATVEIEAFYSHNFLNQKNNYIEKLKESIAGLSKEDAIKILINNPKI